MMEGELGKSYADRETVCREGEKGETMYIVQSGNVNITRKTPDGEVTIATLGSGEIFGEMALFDRLPRSASAVAVGGARILSVDKKKLFTTISRDPTLVFKILESMSRRIRRMDEELAKLKKTRTDRGPLCVSAEEACSMVITEAKELVKADNGSLMLLDDDGQTLSIKAAFGEESPAKMRFSVGEGIAGDVMRTGRAELLNNVTMDSRFVSGTTQIRSMLCVPLKCRESTFGVLNMSNSSERLFTLDDLRLLHSLALYASMAIQNAKNFALLTKAADEVLMHATMLDMA